MLNTRLEGIWAHTSEEEKLRAKTEARVTLSNLIHYPTAHGQKKYFTDDVIRLAADMISFSQLPPLSPVDPPVVPTWTLRCDGPEAGKAVIAVTTEEALKICAYIDSLRAVPVDPHSGPSDEQIEKTAHKIMGASNQFSEGAITSVELCAFVVHQLNELGII